MFWSQPKPCANSMGCVPRPETLTLLRWTTFTWGLPSGGRRRVTPKPIAADGAVVPRSVLVHETVSLPVRLYRRAPQVAFRLAHGEVEPPTPAPEAVPVPVVAGRAEPDQESWAEIGRASCRERGKL